MDSKPESEGADAGKRRSSPSRPRQNPAGKHSKEDYDSAARLFRALSHPFRVQLVCGLLQEPLSQTSIARELGLSQSLVAQHLAVLRRCGVVVGRRAGGEVVLEVTDSRLPGIFAAVCEDAAPFLTSGWRGIAERRKAAARRAPPE